MQKYLNYIPNLSWTWSFGEKWDTVILVVAAVVVACIV